MPSNPKPIKTFQSVIKTDVEKARLTKFEQIAKDLRFQHKINEKESFKRARFLLKVPKKDYKKLERIDKEVLLHYGY